MEVMIMNKELLLEKIKYLSSMPHSALVEHCIYLEQENDNYKAQKYITDFISENGIICEKNKQIQELTNNWNELEEFIKNMLFTTPHENQMLDFILDKMKEIKDNDKV